LVKDLEDFTAFVVKHCEYLDLKQNELDALVIFTYNAGKGNLKKLTANGTRTREEIAEHITAYTKSKSEVNRNGLQKRRNAEKEMFNGNY
jgi:GH24 family phage-related lysozyme (muramidase)